MAESGLTLKEVLATLEFTETTPNRWEAPARGPMRVPACVFADLLRLCSGLGADVDPSGRVAGGADPS